MATYFISADHRCLDLGTVSQLAAAAPGLGRDLLEGLPALRGVLVLATCNRVALLLDADEAAEDDPAGAPGPPAGSSRLGGRDRRGPAGEGERGVRQGPGGEPDGGPAGGPGRGPGARPGASLGSSQADALVGEVAGVLARRAGLDEEGLVPAAWVGAQAYREIFSTASGLKSMVVGERQVAGQLRRAMRTAEQEGTLSPALVRVVEHALVVSRRVAAETGIAGRGRSLAAVGVDLAARHLPPLRECRILLVGTGSYAGATVAVLRDRGAGSISVYSASHRAQAFAQDHGLSAVAPGGLAQALVAADLVVTCRGLGAAVLTRDLVAGAGAQRARPDGTERPLVLLDLSLARDIEEGVEEVPGVVHLDMRRIQAEVPEADEQDLAAARAVVAQETQAFERLLDGRRMDGLIRGLRSQVSDMVAQEAARLRPRPLGAQRAPEGEAGGSGAAGGDGEASAAGDGGPDEQVVTLADAQKALRRLAARLMHHPTVAARRAGEDGQEEAFLEAVETVLGPEMVAGAALAPTPRGGPQP